jgi:hypothetical protein
VLFLNCSVHKDNQLAIENLKDFLNIYSNCGVNKHKHISSENFMLLLNCSVHEDKQVVIENFNAFFPNCWIHEHKESLENLMLFIQTAVSNDSYHVIVGKWC